MKQDEAKNDLRSLPTTFSMNRRKGRMCDVGAVLWEESSKSEHDRAQSNNNKE